MSVLTDLLNINVSLEGFESSALADLKLSLLDSIKRGSELTVSAATVRHIEVAVGEREPSLAKVVDVICKDPLLALRLVSICNFPGYSRGKASLNITQAVNQIGLKKLTSVLTENAPARDLGKVFAGRSAASHVYQKILSACILTEKFITFLSPRKRLNDEAIITCVLSFLPELVLAYYKPNIYAACLTGTIVSQADFQKTYKKLFKVTTNEFAIEIASALSLPFEYSRLLGLLNSPPWNKRSWNTSDWEDARPIATSAYFASAIANEVYSYQGKDSLQTVLKDLASKSEFKIDFFNEILAELEAHLKEKGSELEIEVSELPSYLNITSSKPADGVVQAKATNNIKNQLGSLLLEIKACLRTKTEGGEIGRAAQATFCTLFALVKVLKFDRAILITFDESVSCLKTVVFFGQYSLSISTYRRKLTHDDKDYLADLQAFIKQKPIFNGDPVLDDVWPFAAFPVILAENSIGLFYADRASKEDEALSMEEQLAVVAIAEEWQKVAPEFS